MRFEQDGPDIPSELLTARDEGRVVFFCGAGVSRHKAKMPDFLSLTKKTMKELGLEQDSPAQHILDLMELEDFPRKYRNVLSAGKQVVTADRIFSILEKDFRTIDIEQTVAKILAPSEEPELTCHQAVIDLARTPDNRIQLVTTNFDRLFEACDSNLKFSIPPNLPNLDINSAIDGVIHLHGIVNETYTDSYGNEGFILSTGGYGKAYLSEAWATDFIRAIFSKYTVVFLGYSADDPPIHFLLEALNRQHGNLKNVYAFSSERNVYRWSDRGVTPISYLNSDLLWSSICLWALRAKDTDKWLADIAEIAHNNPQDLSPFERGQIAYLVSDPLGAKVFSELSPPPSSEWLNVFDPYKRYADSYKEEVEVNDRDEERIITPFDLYCIDSDKAPEYIEPMNHFNRDVHEDSWSAFRLTHKDLELADKHEFDYVFFHRRNYLPVLPKRLLYLGDWLSQVSNQITCIHWAVEKNSLHSDIREKIERHLASKYSEISSVCTKAWHYIFQSWDSNLRGDCDREFYRIEDNCEKFGCNLQLLRRYTELRKPIIKASKPFSSRSDNTDPKDLKLYDLIFVQSEYYRPYKNINVPNDLLYTYVKEMRFALDNAINLEYELRDYSINLASLFPENDNSDDFDRTYKFSGLFFDYLDSFKLLVETDIKLAIQECADWSNNFDNTPFVRLKIWACENEDLCDENFLNSFFSKITTKQFWLYQNQRDLLLTISKRWKDFFPATQEHLESVLLQGEEKYDFEDEYYEKRRASSILDRISWLKANGCDFSFNYDDVVGELWKVVPEWSLQESDPLAESGVSRGGWVRTDTNPEKIKHLKVSEILEKAKEIGGRTDDFLVENDPFGGLCSEMPVKAFRALSFAAKTQHYPEWAWRKFLYSQTMPLHSTDRFVLIVGERLCSYDIDFFSQNIFSVSDWFKKHSKLLATSFTKTYDKLISKFLETFSLPNNSNLTAIHKNTNTTDWVSEAINSPAGKITEATFNDPRHIKFKKAWVEKIEALLNLKGNNRVYVLVILGFRLWWFDGKKSKWTKKHLLNVFNNGQKKEKEAIREGFFKHHQMPNIKFLKKVIPSILDEIQSISLVDDDKGHAERSISFFLICWNTRENEERLIDSNTVRTILSKASRTFLHHVLWQIWVWYRRQSEGSQWIESPRVFFQEAWPRQKRVRSASVTSDICRIIIERSEYFEEMYAVTYNFLTRVEKNSHFFYELDKEDSPIILEHSETLINLLHQVLPEDSSIWPYDAGRLLSTISKVKPEILTKPEFIELNRIFKNT